MDRSIIEPARERARIAGSNPGSPAAKERRPFPASRAERTRVQTNADYLPGRLHRGLATDEESSIYWACGLLFVMGVLLARSDTHVAPNHGVTTGVACHGYL
jgi:hypothetical protein